MTNGDRIRQMTDEELARLLNGIGSCIVCAWYRDECKKHIGCKGGIIEWLKREASEDADN